MRNSSTQTLRTHLAQLWAMSSSLQLLASLDVERVEAYQFQDTVKMIARGLSSELSELEELYCEIEDELTKPFKAGTRQKIAKIEAQRLAQAGGNDE